MAILMVDEYYDDLANERGTGFSVILFFVFAIPALIGLAGLSIGLARFFRSRVS